MIRMVNYRDKLIRIKDIGSGDTIVLLHGYIESLEIWDEFALELSKNYRVISIDLPGHGKSAIYESHSMEFMADAVRGVFDSLNLTRVFLIGHSMGGYVALAFLEFHSHLLSGLCLFHSSPFADSEEKITNRDREINLIKAGKATILCKEHVPKTYAHPNSKSITSYINRGIEIAHNTPEVGIIAALNGMKKRTDKTKILKNTKVPFLFILGEKDNFIPFKMASKIELPAKHQIVVLKDSGHMGFIEEPEESLKCIISFISDNCK